PQLMPPSAHDQKWKERHEAPLRPAPIDSLFVTERVANNNDTYTVGKDGRASGSTVIPADAESPFGFYFSNRNQLFISDDFNDAAGAGALSSYIVSDDGGLQLVNSALE